MRVYQHYLEQLKKLRSLQAPRWIIKTTQVNLVLAREGLKPVSIGKTPSKRAAELMERHVKPLMGGDHD